MHDPLEPIPPDPSLTQTTHVELPAPDEFDAALDRAIKSTRPTFERVATPAIDPRIEAARFRAEHPPTQVRRVRRQRQRDLARCLANFKRDPAFKRAAARKRKAKETRRGGRAR